jgi:hypothetical protein
VTRYDFAVCFFIPEETENEGTPEAIARLIASGLRVAAAGLAPNNECLTQVTYTARHTRAYVPRLAEQLRRRAEQLRNQTAAEPTLGHIDDGPGDPPDRGLSPVAREWGETSALEPAYEIDARRRGGPPEVQMKPAPSPRYARCGNCGARLELTDDPIENHHRAMRHSREECEARAAGSWTPDELAKQLYEFNMQPHVIRLKAEYAAQLERSKEEQAVDRAAALQGVTPDMIRQIQSARPAPAPAGWLRRMWRRLWR